MDGGHSEETIKHDGNTALDLITYNKDVVIVFDDYYHEGRPEGMGCNKFIDSLDNFYEVTHLPARTLSDDGRLIGMVQVRRADISLQMQTSTPAGAYTYTRTIEN